MDDSITVLNKVFTNRLEEEVPSIQSPSIHTSLLPHQIQLVHAMKVHQHAMLHGYGTQQFISGRLGIVADPPGSGKTLSILTFLASSHSIQGGFGELDPNSNRFFSSFHRSSQDTSSTHVIIVPCTILDQWQAEICRHTRLQPFVIQNRRILRNRSTVNAICASPFILTTNRMYREVYTFCQNNQIRWKNLFFDDASTLYMSPNDPIPSAEFIWFVTSQWHHLLFKNMHLPLNSDLDVHKDCRTWMQRYGSAVLCTTDASAFYKSILPWTHAERYRLVLRSRAPIPYSSANTLTIQCRSQYTLANLPMSVLGTNYSGLTNETIPSIFSALGIPSWTLERLKEVHGRSELIDAKLTNDCSICLDTPHNMVFLPCCMNVFCGACILRQLIVHGQCPLCRSLLVLPSLLPLKLRPEEQMAMTKRDTCVDYILNHRSQTFLIYTVFENTYYQIQPILEEQGIVCDLLDLPLNRFHKSLEKFRSGTTTVLFISNLELVRGLNLSKADCLILFYEIPSYERRQILLHSMVRLDPLLQQKTIVQLQSPLE